METSVISQSTQVGMRGVNLGSCLGLIVGLKALEAAHQVLAIQEVVVEVHATHRVRADRDLLERRAACPVQPLESNVKAQ